MTASLSVSTNAHLLYKGPRRWFRLVVHPTREDMRRAARRYDGTELDPEASACCQPTPVKFDGSDPAHFGGVVRFVHGDMTAEIVIHEMTHAAAVVYRMDVDPVIDLGNGCRHEEETLTHLIGDLADGALTTLIEAGCWPK